MAAAAGGGLPCQAHPSCAAQGSCRACTPASGSARAPSAPSAASGVSAIPCNRPGRLWLQRAGQPGSPLVAHACHLQQGCGALVHCFSSAAIPLRSCLTGLFSPALCIDQSLGAQPRRADPCTLQAAGWVPREVPLVMTSSRGSLLQTQEALANAVLVHERAGAVIIEAPLQHADLCLTAQACLCVWSQPQLRVRAPAEGCPAVRCCQRQLTLQCGRWMRTPRLRRPGSC